MNDPIYTACFKEAAFYLIPDPCLIQISGEDRLPFLQRQTTNDLRVLEPGQSLITVLTSPTARILDVFMIHEENSVSSNPTLHLIALPGQAGKTDHYLRSRVFFMDKVDIFNASDLFDQLDLVGPSAWKILQHLGLENPPQPSQVIAIEQSNFFIKVINQAGIVNPGYRLLIERAHIESLVQTLSDLGIPALTPLFHKIHCVEAGIPQPLTELSEQFTPLEIGLSASISMNKGCYTGQEVIARQVNYDKVTRHLVGLALEGVAAPGEPVFSEGKPVGTVTSAVVSPRFGSIALAVLRRPYHQPGTILASEQAGSLVRAVVKSLPFSSYQEGL